MSSSGGGDVEPIVLGDQPEAIKLDSVGSKSSDGTEHEDMLKSFSDSDDDFRLVGSWEPWYRRKPVIVAAGVVSIVVLVATILTFVLVSRKPEAPATQSHETLAAPTLRLPSTYAPSHYDVTLVLEMSPDDCVNNLNGIDCPYSGTVVVDLDVYGWENRLLIHSAENVDIKKALVKVDGKTYAPTSIERIPQYEYFQLDFVGLPLNAKAAVLTVEFDATIETSMDGFYISRYTDVNTGLERGMYATQFESTYARRAFPCFDEPAKKADFTLHFITPTDVEVYSNSNPSGSPSSAGTGLKQTDFKPTAVMSSYLVAFIVGEFDIDSTVASNGVAIRVITPGGAGLIDDAAFALAEAAAVLPLYDEFFGIPYPLEKLDLAAIPDFDAGAMENWGLITYRETAMLVSSTEGTASQFQRVSTVICHEISHQWFGDLVTMEWWNDLWLNEGFASFMEYYGVNALHPDWKMYDQFVVFDHQRAMDLDSLHSTHTLSIGDKDNPGSLMDPADINQLFDAISYSKGASVIRLCKSYFDTLGTTSFQDGLTQYLTIHEYSNAETRMLWDAITDVSGTDVNSMMENWTKEKGYPVVNINPHVGDSSVRVSQARFFLLPEDLHTDDGNNAPDSTIWTIPLTLATEDTVGSAPLQHLMTHREETVGLNHNNQWVMGNVGRPSFVRVNYTADNWYAIADALAADLSAVPTAIDRAGLLDDAFAFAEGAQLDPHVPLSLAAAFEPDREYIVWATIMSRLGQLSWRMTTAPTAHRDALDQFILELLPGVVDDLGYAPSVDDGHLDELTRISVLSGAAGAGNTTVIDTILSMYDDEENIDQNLLPLLFSTYVSHGPTDGYDTILSRYLNSDDESPGTVVSLMRALYHTRDVDNLNDLLGRLFTDIRPQDFTSVLTGIARNPLGRELAWEWAKDHWDVILDSYGSGGFALNSIITGLCGRFDTENDYNEVAAFFAANPTPNGSKAIAQSLESIKINERFRDLVAPAVGDALLKLTGN